MDPITAIALAQALAGQQQVSAQTPGFNPEANTPQVVPPTQTIPGLGFPQLPGGMGAPMPASQQQPQGGKLSRIWQTLTQDPRMVMLLLSTGTALANPSPARSRFSNVQNALAQGMGSLGVLAQVQNQRAMQDWSKRMEEEKLRTSQYGAESERTRALAEKSQAESLAASRQAEAELGKKRLEQDRRRQEEMADLQREENDIKAQLGSAQVQNTRDYYDILGKQAAVAERRVAVLEEQAAAEREAATVESKQKLEALQTQLQLARIAQAESRALLTITRAAAGSATKLPPEVKMAGDMTSRAVATVVSNRWGEFKEGEIAELTKTTFNNFLGMIREQMGTIQPGGGGGGEQRMGGYTQAEAAAAAKANNASEGSLRWDEDAQAWLFNTKSSGVARGRTMRLPAR